MQHVTVLAVQNDPFRVDTDARHRDGKWLADNLQELGITRMIHIRGLHYILIGRPKPNGLPYTSTDAAWCWLGSNAVKAARWLGISRFTMREKLNRFGLHPGRSDEPR
jgi:hypothetical protein